jgi:hypothetical protein
VNVSFKISLFIHADVDVKQGKDDYDDADADAYENSNSVKEKSVHTLTRT